MKYRQIKKGENVSLSILGYGGMRFPTVAGKIDEEKAGALLKEAIDNGVNYIDTAYFYHGGQSEGFIGKFLEETGLRSRVYVATKLPPWLVSQPEDMARIFEVQQKRLRVSCIDFYLLHALNRENWDKFLKMGALDFLKALKEEGKVKHLGFSFHGDREVFKEIVDAFPWDFCQIQYNILDVYNQAGRSGAVYAAEKGLAVFVMEPLRGGTLVRNIPAAIEKRLAEHEPARSLAEWSFRWIWNQPEITMVLSGMTEEAHLHNNLHYADSADAGALSRESLAMIDEIRALYLSLQKVPCTGCQYCMPCPYGVDIPRCFELYNSKYLLNQRVRTFYWMQLGGINGNASYASLCRHCGKCMTHCPQKIQIPVELEKVAKDMEGPLFKPTMWLGKRVMKGVNAILRRF